MYSVAVKFVLRIFSEHNKVVKSDTRQEVLI